MVQDNIIPFESRKPPEEPKHPPMIDMPEATKILTFSIVLVFVCLWAASYFIPAFPLDRIYEQLGFVSARWTGDAPFGVTAVLSLVTTNFLHGNWFHMGINAATLVAFGAGIEKRLGGRAMLIIFFGTSLIAFLTHMVILPHSLNPVIGASGGISGLFGAALVMLKQDGRLGGPSQTILPTAMLWIVITILFGIMGGPEGEQIAWVAHIGGFVAGLGLAQVMLKRQA